MKPEIGGYAKYMDYGSIEVDPDGEVIDNMIYKYGKIIDIIKTMSNDIPIYRFKVQMIDRDNLLISNADDFEYITRDEMMVISL